MTPADMAALHRRCFETPRPWRAEEFSGLLRMDGVRLLPHPQGFALGRVILDECELLTLAVEPAARRRGIGRRLVLDLEQWAVACGGASIHLEVSAENRPALGLYQSTGFTQAGQRPGYYRAPDGRRIDAVILSRSLR